LSEIIDAAFAEDERAGYLSEVREHLPAFLSEVAYERADPVADVSALLNLRSEDLRKVINTHLAFTEPIIRFVQSLPEGLRRPISSSLRPPVISQAVRGPVDWAATHRARYQQGGNPALFVVRPAERIFNTPENQALLWCLETLRARIESIRPVESDSSGVMRPGESWWPHVTELSRELEEGLRPRWLSAVVPARPTPLVLSRLRSSRLAFYAETLPDAIETMRRYTERPGPAEITELLCQRYFEPRLNWQLFELVVALRLTRTFEQRLGTKRSPTSLLVGRSQQPFARYELDGGDEIRFWYQTWPDLPTRSLLREARERHQLDWGSSRPDLVLERRSGGKLVDSILLEIKASRNSKTLGAGLLQMLGYLKERPEFWPAETPAWLVAPKSSAFKAATSMGEPLWMVDADEVAIAAADRLLACG
jgi:hypothetical protein